MTYGRSLTAECTLKIALNALLLDKLLFVLNKHVHTLQIYLSYFSMYCVHIYFLYVVEMFATTNYLIIKKHVKTLWWTTAQD